MFGSVSEWFHKSILGIQQTENSVAFSDIVIKPAIVGGLQWAKGHYKSVRGKIGNSWWRFGDDVFMNIEIPPNTKATVYLPIFHRGQPDVYEGDYLLVRKGEAAENLPAEFKFVRNTGDHIVLEIGSGNYEFRVRN